MARHMRASTSKAGGCFLTICILGGFVLGMSINDPMKGVLLGTAAGVILALLVWLADRRRAP